jgi:hypothetical protein
MKEQIGVRPTFHLHVHVAFLIIDFFLFPLIFCSKQRRVQHAARTDAPLRSLKQKGGVVCERQSVCVCVSAIVCWCDGRIFFRLELSS